MIGSGLPEIRIGFNDFQGIFGFRNMSQCDFPHVLIDRLNQFGLDVSLLGNDLCKILDPELKEIKFR